MRIKNIFTLLFILIFLAPFSIEAKVSKLRTNILTGITAAGCITTLIAAKKVYNQECKNTQIKPTIKGYGNFLKKVVLSSRYPRNCKLALKQHPKLMKLILGTQLFLGAIFVSKYMDNLKQKKLNNTLCVRIAQHRQLNPYFYATTEASHHKTLENLIKRGADVNAPYSDGSFKHFPNHCYNGDLPLALACRNNNPLAIKILVQNWARIPPALKSYPAISPRAKMIVKDAVREKICKLNAQILIHCNSTLGDPHARNLRELPYAVRVQIAEWLGYSLKENQHRALYVPIPRLMPADALANRSQENDISPHTS